MKLISMILLLAIPPCTTPKDKVYAKVKAIDTDGGGFTLEPVCPKGMGPDKNHLPDTVTHGESYADAINGIQQIECIQIPVKKG